MTFVKLLAYISSIWIVVYTLCLASSHDEKYWVKVSSAEQGGAVGKKNISRPERICPLSVRVVSKNHSKSMKN